MRSPVHANFGLAESTKRQSNVNLYLSSFPGEKVCFHTQICKMENAKKCIEEALDSLNIHGKSRKLYKWKYRKEPVELMERFPYNPIHLLCMQSH